MLERFRICDDFRQCLSKLGSNSKLAVALSREYTRWIRLSSALQFYCFEKPEIIHSYALKFFLRKDFLYMNELNKFIKAASESGLIEKWRSYVNIQSINTQNSAERKSGLITLENIYGALGLWIVLQTLVLCIFLLEMLIHRQARKSNRVRRFWIFVEKIISPERHFMLKTKWV